MSNETKTDAAGQKARRARLRQAIGMFLDGVSDREDDSAPLARYAQVWKGSLTVCVTDTDAAEDRLDGTYDPAGAGAFKWLGTIDLDTGDLVASSGETALGRGLPGGAS